MRVIAGKARSLHLKTIEGLDTRPTTDRIKETLFNMINDELYGASFLDLFSGSGGIGIEALSRGARKAVFVESSRKAAACIQENLKFTRLASDGEVLVMDVFRALDLLAVRGESFSVILWIRPITGTWKKSSFQTERFPACDGGDTADRGGFSGDRFLLSGGIWL